MGVVIPTVRGRDPELTVLGQPLDQPLSGVGTVVLVEGGTGMGKSRLLAEVTAIARLLSIRVGSGVADPADAMPDAPPRTGPPGPELISNYDNGMLNAATASNGQTFEGASGLSGATALQGVA